MKIPDSLWIALTSRLVPRNLKFEGYTAVKLVPQFRIDKELALYGSAHFSDWGKIMDKGKN